jgi:hypothetical protein
MQEQSNGDWVVWNDTQELIRRTRTLESVGVYGNAIFDLAGTAGTTPEALSHAALNEPVKGNVYLSAGAMRSAVSWRSRRSAKRWWEPDGAQTIWKIRSAVPSLPSIRISRYS